MALPIAWQIWISNTVGVSETNNTELGMYQLVNSSGYQTHHILVIFCMFIIKFVIIK